MSPLDCEKAEQVTYTRQCGKIFRKTAFLWNFLLLRLILLRTQDIITNKTKHWPGLAVVQIKAAFLKFGCKERINGALHCCTLGWKHILLLQLVLLSESTHIQLVSSDGVSSCHWSQCSTHMGDCSSQTLKISCLKKLSSTNSSPCSFMHAFGMHEYAVYQ